MAVQLGITLVVLCFVAYAIARVNYTPVLCYDCTVYRTQADCNAGTNQVTAMNLTLNGQGATMCYAAKDTAGVLSTVQVTVDGSSNFNGLQYCDNCENCSTEAIANSLSCGGPQTYNGTQYFTSCKSRDDICSSLQVNELCHTCTIYSDNQCTASAAQSTFPLHYVPQNYMCQNAPSTVPSSVFQSFGASFSTFTNKNYYGLTICNNPLCANCTTEVPIDTCRSLNYGRSMKCVTDTLCSGKYNRTQLTGNQWICHDCQVYTQKSDCSNIALAKQQFSTKFLNRGEFCYQVEGAQPTDLIKSYYATVLGPGLQNLYVCADAGCNNCTFAPGDNGFNTCDSGVTGVFAYYRCQTKEQCALPYDTYNKICVNVSYYDQSKKDACLAGTATPYATTHVEFKSISNYGYGELTECITVPSLGSGLALSGGASSSFLKTYFNCGGVEGTAYYMGDCKAGTTSGGAVITARLDLPCMLPSFSPAPTPAPSSTITTTTSSSSSPQTTSTTTGANGGSSTTAGGNGGASTGTPVTPTSASNTGTTASDASLLVAAYVWGAALGLSVLLL